MLSFDTVSHYLSLNAPEQAVACLRPHVAERAAKWFKDRFDGDVLYALKANNSPVLVDTLINAGITDFDVASIPEIEQLASKPGIRMHLMNPIKSRATIRRAYYEFGIRSFALDSYDELNKILDETDNADDLRLVVRLGCNGAHALIPLDAKYGVPVAQASDLLVATRQAARELGITFHVGSQMVVPDAYGAMLTQIGDLIISAGVMVDWLDVGGGFPSNYGTETAPPPLDAFMNAIENAIPNLRLPDSCRLACEPGRALVAEAESLLLRVDARRGSELYINDGAYGALFDALYADLNFPVRVPDTSHHEMSQLVPFSFWGPTCDSMDSMPGPFLLPDTIKEGDYFEIGITGAYGRVLANQFNGFGRYEEVIVRDEPMFTMYPVAEAQAEINAATA